MRSSRQSEHRVCQIRATSCAGTAPTGFRHDGNPYCVRESSGGRYWDRTSDLCRVKVPGGLSTHSQNRADAAESLALLSFLLHIIAQRFSALLAVMWTRCGRETSATIGHLPVDGGSNTLRRLSRASRTSRSNQVSRSGQRQDRDTRPYPRPTNLFTMRTPPSNLSLASQLRTRIDTEPPNLLIRRTVGE